MDAGSTFVVGVDAAGGSKLVMPRARGMRRKPQPVQGCSRMASLRVPSSVTSDRGYRVQQGAKERHECSRTYWWESTTGRVGATR